MADAVPQDEIPQVDVIPGANGDAPVVLLNGVAQPEGEQQDQGDLQPDQLEVPPPPAVLKARAPAAKTPKG